MRKTTEYKAENRLTVDIEGLMAMLSCGEVTAKKIADYAEARAVSYTHLDVYKRQAQSVPSVPDMQLNPCY